MSLSLPSRIVNVKGFSGHKDFAPISDWAAQTATFWTLSGSFIPVTVHYVDVDASTSWSSSFMFCISLKYKYSFLKIVFSCIEMFIHFIFLVSTEKPYSTILMFCFYSFLKDNDNFSEVSEWHLFVYLFIY